MLESKLYWEQYYLNHKMPSEPSPFAKFVSPFLGKGKRLIELGCGNGRDSIFFVKEGISVTSIDQCEKEIAYLNEKFSDINDIKFLASDMTNMKNDISSDYFYSRFTIHSIDSEGENKLLDYVSRNINPNGLFFIEVRSVNDELFGKGKKLGKNTYYTDHPRRFIELTELRTNLTKFGFEIIYQLESKGLAPYKEEDPTVIRVIAQKYEVNG